MSDDVDTPPHVTRPPDVVVPAPAYVSPLIERLGTLAELTRGGDVDISDGVGGAGDGSEI